MHPLLRRIGQTLLISVTLGGSVLWLAYLLWVREPMLDWQLVVAGFLLSAALGWWPFISLGVVVALELVVLFFPGLTDRSQILEEIAVFWALGLGFGMIARQFLHHHESLLLDETHPLKTVTPTREAGRSVVASPSASPLPPTAPLAPQFLPSPEPLAPPAPASQPAPAAPAPMLLPPGAPPAPPAVETLPFSQPAPVQPPPSSISLTAATPLRTQELDLGDFRAWAAAQQAATPAASTGDASELPTGLGGRRSSSGSSSLNAEAAQAPGAPTEPPAGETDPASPHAQLLLWYNQFSAVPWSEAALQKRYPGGRWLEQAAEDVRSCLELARAPRVANLPTTHFDLEDVQLFQRCELRFLLRRQGAPDLHGLTPQHPPLDWLSTYQETRRAARGGTATVREIPPEALGSDASRALAGRPDALLEVSGQCEVVTLVRPTTPQEPLSGIGALGAAQLAVAASLGIPLSGGISLVHLPTHGDRRNAARVAAVEDITTEFRRLDGFLERMRRILGGELAPKPQARPAVCDACGHRHACPGYVGQRPRQDLNEPPALFARFQP